MTKHIPQEIKRAIARYMIDEHDYITTQCFDNPCLVDDRKLPVYQDDTVRVLYCQTWCYFEIYGLGNWEDYPEFAIVNKYHRDDLGECQGGYLDTSEFIDLLKELKEC